MVMFPARLCRCLGLLIALNASWLLVCRALRFKSAVPIYRRTAVFSSVFGDAEAAADIEIETVDKVCLLLFYFIMLIAIRRGHLSPTYKLI